MRKTPLWIIIVLVISLLLFAFTKLEETLDKSVSFVNWMDYKIALEASKERNKPVFIYFSADWCRPCKKFSRTTLRNQSTADILNKSFIPVKIYEDDPKYGQGGKTDLLDRYSVKAYPTFVIVNSKQKEIYRFKGARKSSVFKKELKKVLKEKI